MKYLIESLLEIKSCVKNIQGGDRTVRIRVKTPHRNGTNKN